MTYSDVTYDQGMDFETYEFAEDATDVVAI